MTWVTWRQYRVEFIIALAVLASMAAFVVPIGIQKLALFEDSGLGPCLRVPGEDCSRLARRFIDGYRSFNGFNIWLNFIPAIVGILLAAPIVMEFEQRTYRLAWTQSVTRVWWIATKLGLAVLGAVAFSAVFAAIMVWWQMPIVRVDTPFNQAFNITGVVPLGYTLASMAFELAVGVVTRRTIPSMLGTLVAYFCARLVVGEVLRPAFMDPKVVTEPFLSGKFGGPDVSPLPERAWLLNSSVVDAMGNLVSEAQLSQLCRNAGDKAVLDCLAGTGLMNHIPYHPAERFWTFQFMEAGMYVGMAVVFLAVTVWWVNSRIR